MPRPDSPRTPSPAPAPAEGQVLPVGGGYRLLQRLGQGAFGEVWRAAAPGGVQVAVKLISRAVKPEQARREQEALEIIKLLRHNYLLSLQAFFPLEDRLIIVLELADGSLHGRLRACPDGQGLPVAELLRYLAEAAEALDYLHEQKVQHRDIKPANLLLLGNHLKVADCGLAKVLETVLLQNASQAGTPAYMAPEIWGNKLSPHSDQYSLAVTYGELRLGHFPIPYDNLLNLMYAHLYKPPELDPLPADEQAVLLRALAKDPRKRYPSCTAFALALGQVRRTAAPRSRVAPAPRPVESAGGRRAPANAAAQPPSNHPPEMPAKRRGMAQEFAPPRDAGDVKRQGITLITGVIAAVAVLGLSLFVCVVAWAVLMPQPFRKGTEVAGQQTKEQSPGDGTTPPSTNKAREHPAQQPATVPNQSATGAKLTDPSSNGPAGTPPSPSGIRSIKIKLVKLPPLCVGGEVLLKFSLEESTDITGEARVFCEGLPDGVFAQGVRVPLGIRTGELKVIVGADAKPVEDLKVTLVATDGEQRADAEIRLTVLPKVMALKLELPKCLMLTVGKSDNPLRVKVFRTGFSEPIELRFFDLPRGVTIPTTRIEAGSVEATIKVAVDDSAGVVDTTIRVEAIGDPGWVWKLRMRLRKMALKLELPECLMLTVGKSDNPLRVKVFRTGFSEPIELRFFDLPRGVTIPTTRIEAGSVEATIKVAVDDSAGVVDTTIRVEAIGDPGGVWKLRMRLRKKPEEDEVTHRKGLGEDERALRKRLDQAIAENQTLYPRLVDVRVDATGRRLEVGITPDPSEPARAEAQKQVLRKLTGNREIVEKKVSLAEYRELIRDKYGDVLRKRLVEDEVALRKKLEQARSDNATLYPPEVMIRMDPTETKLVVEITVDASDPNKAEAQEQAVQQLIDEYRSKKKLRSDYKIVVK